MAENKTIQLEVETNLGSLRSQLRAAQAEVAAMADKFGATSAEAANAAKRAAELRDRIQDAKNLTAAFNPEAKFAAIGQAVGAAAGGFTAFQGALGLAGVESENLQQQLLKVQSALALSQGLEQLGGLADALKNVKTVGVNAFNSIKTAIGSTGIGLLVVALGTIYAYWDDITKSVKASFPAFENIGTIFNKIKEVAFGVGSAITNFILSPFKAIGKLLQGDFKGALEEIKDGIDVVGNYQKGALNERQAQQDDANKKRLEALIKQKDDEIAVEKAKGKDTYKLELENYKRKKELAKGNQEELKKLRQEEKILIATHQKELRDKAKAKAAEDLKAAQDAAEKEAKLRIKAAEDLAKELEQVEENHNKRWKEITDKQNKEHEKDAQDAYNNQKGLLEAALIDDENNIQAKKDLLLIQMAMELENKELTEGEKLAIQKKYAKQIEQVDKDATDKRKQLEKDVVNSKIQIAQDSLALISNITSLFGQRNEKEAKKAFQIDKAAKLASATISGIEGTINAYTTAQKSPITALFPAYPAIQAGLAGAFAAVNIAKISQTQFQGGNNNIDSSNAPMGGASQSMTPQFNVVGGNQTSQLLQGLSMQPLKAYVVASDITTAQMLEQKAIKTSVL